MPEFSSVQGGVIRTAGTTAGASTGSTTITANASANTKGTAVELIASTEFDANWALVLFTDAGGNLAFLSDIMIGAATEQVIIPDLLVFSKGASGAGGSFSPYLFPIFIPKGSRISARCQASTGSSTIQVAVTLIAGTMIGNGQPPSWVSAYGAVASSTGTNVDPGASANTDSAWTQLTAATDRAHNWLCVAGQFGDGVLGAATKWRVSIGIGAATEQALVPDLHFSATINEDAPYCSAVCLPCFVPAGARLTAKARANVTTDGDRDVNLKLYGAG